MKIINHGDWVSYKPELAPAFLPPNTMYCKRATDGIDWYDFLRRRPFDCGSIKMMVRRHIVQVATDDASRLFPADCALIEVLGLNNVDPQLAYAGCIYDPIAQTFDERG